MDVFDSHIGAGSRDVNDLKTCHYHNRRVPTARVSRSQGDRTLEESQNFYRFLFDRLLANQNKDSHVTIARFLLLSQVFTLCPRSAANLSG